MEETRVPIPVRDVEVDHEPEQAKEREPDTLAPNQNHDWAQHSEANYNLQDWNEAEVRNFLLPQATF
jgi:hypothetical protein